MNIYQKLIECRKAVPFLKKDNAGYQFKYVSSSQTLGALREAMDAQGLLLIPRLVNERVLDHTTKKGDHNYFTILNMEFTWVNADEPTETVVCPWVGQGLDDGEKGVGKALTYSEKFFLLKFFNIPTDKDDPDANQKAPEKGGRSGGNTNDTARQIPVGLADAPPVSPKAPVSTDAEKPPTVKLATAGQVKQIQIIMKDRGFTERQAILDDLTGFCGRLIKSSKEITFDEAHAFIEANIGKDAA